MALYSCYICERDIFSGPAAKKAGQDRMTHHLLPRALHRKLIGSGLWSREDCLNSIVDLCSQCHKGCHGYFSHVEMARFLTTPDRLKQAMLDLGWISHLEWNESTPLKEPNYQSSAASLYKVKNFSTRLVSYTETPNDPVANASPLDHPQDGLLKQVSDLIASAVDAQCAAIDGKLKKASRTIEEQTSTIEEQTSTIAKLSKTVEKLKAGERSLKETLESAAESHAGTVESYNHEISQLKVGLASKLDAPKNNGPLNLRLTLQIPDLNFAGNGAALTGAALECPVQTQTSCTIAAADASDGLSVEHAIDVDSEQMQNSALTSKSAKDVQISSVHKDTDPDAGSESDVKIESDAEDAAHTVVSSATKRIPAVPERIIKPLPSSPRTTHKQGRSKGTAAKSAASESGVSDAEGSDREKESDNAVEVSEDSDIGGASSGSRGHDNDEEDTPRKRLKLKDDEKSAVSSDGEGGGSEEQSEESEEEEEEEEEKAQSAGKARKAAPKQPLRIQSSVKSTCDTPQTTTGSSSISQSSKQQSSSAVSRAKSPGKASSGRAIAARAYASDSSDSSDSDESDSDED